MRIDRVVDAHHPSGVERLVRLSSRAERTHRYSAATSSLFSRMTTLRFSLRLGVS
jgi:hypothetical protein